MPNNFIITNEALVGVGWEPYKYYRAFSENKRIFSKDTKVIIYIRKPSEFLNSVYLQSIKLLNIKKESEYFINEKDNFLKKNCYNVNGFSYLNLINLYKTYFENVYFEKYENINEFNIFKKIFDLNSEDVIFLQRQSEEIVNVSLSYMSVKILFFLNYFFDLRKYDNFIRSRISKDYNFKDKILRNLMIRNIITIINKIIPSRKYKISFKTFPIDISKLDKEYKDINI